MKRMKMNLEIRQERLEVGAEEIPTEADTLYKNLQLLYGVPLAYLVPEPEFLPAESLRFFYVDENFVKAMLNGAASIGRSTEQDKRADRSILKTAVSCSKAGSAQIRRDKVHSNHHRKLNRAVSDHTGVRTGFLLRSSLVYRRKGIAVCAFHGQQQLPALRMETLTKDIMLGIFDGELDRLTISEPPSGLRFGCHGSEKRNMVLSLTKPGEPVPGAYYEVKTNGKGRVDVLEAVDQIDKILKHNEETREKISSHIFAYEWLLSAQRAEFLKKQEEQV